MSAPGAHLPKGRMKLYPAAVEAALENGDDSLLRWFVPLLVIPLSRVPRFTREDGERTLLLEGDQSNQTQKCV